jgi:hypothetical protein
MWLARDPHFDDLEAMMINGNWLSIALRVMLLLR